MSLSLNNSCFPVKHSKLVRSEWVLGLLISNLLYKFSVMNFNVKASEELEPPQVPVNGDSWVFWGEPCFMGAIPPFCVLLAGSEMPSVVVSSPGGF